MLKQRSEEPELMDDLTLSSEDLRRNLKELEVINRWLGGHKVVLSALDNLIAAPTTASGPLHIADIGCGGGDTLRTIARWAKRKGVTVKLTGIDANDFMVQYARQHCASYPEISVKQHNVFSESFKQEKYDVIVCSLFCHHFTDARLLQLFRQLQTQAASIVIINDLHRHWLAYYFIMLVTKLFSRSHLVKNDAPLSVWRAFKRQELVRLVQQAGISAYRLKWVWPFRWQLLLYAK